VDPNTEVRQSLPSPVTLRKLRLDPWGIYIYQYYPSYSQYIPMIIHQIPRNSSSETGWWFLYNHLEKYEFVSWDDYPIYEMENKIHV
jgi:hypothetical protein